MLYTEYDSPVGRLLLCSDGTALTGVYFPTQKVDVSAMERRDSLPLLRRAQAWLEAYFAGTPEPVDFPLEPGGTAFQRRVWQHLRSVPFGQTVTYGEIARKLGPCMSAQAVGQAVGKNPISILIPCHRCLGARKKLTGYAGGLEQKKWLLTHEGCGFRD